jgi:hypothetical protein
LSGLPGQGGQCVLAISCKYLIGGIPSQLCRTLFDDSDNLVEAFGGICHIWSKGRVKLSFYLIEAIEPDQRAFHGNKAAREIYGTSPKTACFHLGDLIEVGTTARIFTGLKHRLTEDYITGRFG